MGNIRNVAACLCFLSALLVGVKSSCYSAFDCFDRDTNTTYESGDSWQTGNCFHCSCWSHKVHVKTCFEQEETEQVPYQFPNVRKSSDDAVYAHLEVYEPLAPKEVIVSEEEAEVLECPPILEDVFDREDVVDLRLPNLRQVNYVMEFKGMGCCALYGYPVNVHPKCQSIWKKEECRYDVVDRETQERCSYSFGMIGK
ncbi:uncharacterized protein LOC143469008 [Clavelina lepadiformis]|uniref:Uncharacterized protein n=1 Tax=Clavelina lepadiformis TaxID=159417 RepID=A0ABP0F1Q8_CLALP